MHNCDYCGQSFKSIQGLLGHERMKHNVITAQNSGQCQCGAGQNSGEYSVSFAQNNGQHKGSTAQNSQPGTGENQSCTGESCQYRETLLERDECLGLIQETLGRMVDCLDRIEAVNHQDNPDDDGQPEEHTHGDNCKLCVHEQLKGVQRSAVWHDNNVPGAKEAREHAMTGEQKVTILQ